MWNKAKCVLLETKKNSGLLLGLSKFGKLVSYDIECTNPNNDVYSVKQHLYIVNDDVIKEGWIIGLDDKPHYITENGKYPKVILATTDKSLLLDYVGYEHGTARKYESKVYLPQIPQSFIKEYITEYNKGHQITDCLIEFEGIDCEGKIVLDNRVNEGCGFRIKLNQLNEINIKTVKDSFSRSELILILNKFGSKVYGEYTRNETMEDFTYNWIEQNL